MRSKEGGKASSESEARTWVDIPTCYDRRQSQQHAASVLVRLKLWSSKTTLSTTKRVSCAAEHSRSLWHYHVPAWVNNVPRAEVDSARINTGENSHDTGRHFLWSYLRPAWPSEAAPRLFTRSRPLRCREPVDGRNLHSKFAAGNAQTHNFLFCSTKPQAVLHRNTCPGPVSR